MAGSIPAARQHLIDAIAEHVRGRRTALPPRALTQFINAYHRGVDEDDLVRLAERMTALMHEAQGVGLAATQVGVLRRLFVFVDEGEDRLLVNPVITKRSRETDVDDEGCLSLREVLVPVERETGVTIEGVDLQGAPVKLDLELPSARIVQHELDHLDGVLIIDRTDDESRRTALARLRPQPVLGVR